MMLALLLAAVPQYVAVERWREEIELDLAGEVVRAGLPHVTGFRALANDGEAVALVARALFAVGDESRALELLDHARPERSPAFIDLARARIAIERDELDRAIEILLTPSGPRFPAIPECRLLAGRALFRAGKGDRAGPLLEQFLAAAPLDVEAPGAWYMLVQIAAAKRDLARAEVLRAKAAESARWQSFYRTRRLQVRERPGEPLPRLGLAELWLAANEPARAKAVCAEIVKMAPDFCRGHEALGIAERRLGDAAAARKSLERAVACDAALPRAHLELARLLDAQGEKDAALARHRRYVELGGAEPLAPR